MPDRVLLCAKDHNFDDCVVLASEHGIGIEVQTFAYPDVLDGDWRAVLRRYRDGLRGVPGEIAMHGPFLDMASGSPDRRIEQVVRERVQQALEIAHELGARTVVFHANFIASMRNTQYRTDWTERQIAFWGPLAEQAWQSGQVIALENMWEFDPDLIGNVLRALALPGLRACLDVGHSHLFSELDLGVWVERLAPFLIHVHLNNNGGIVDEHQGLDEGVLEYAPILSCLRRLPAPPALALEIEAIEDMKRSLSFLDLPR